MGILQHIDILGDALGICVVAHHLCGEINKLAWAEPAAVCAEEIQELLGSYMCVERPCMPEIAVLIFANCVLDKFSHGTFSGVVGCVILDKDGMFSLPAGMNKNGGCIVINGQIG